MIEKIVPKCADGTIAVISAEGRWLPCCNFVDHGNDYENSIFKEDEYLIANNERVDRFHEKDSFRNWMQKQIEDYSCAHKVCKDRCSSTFIQYQNETPHHPNMQVATINAEQTYFIRNLYDLKLFLEAHGLEYEFEED